MTEREREVRQMSGQALAYLGDNVIELCVRSALIGRGFSRSGEMNREALHYVSAQAQAEAIERILPYLSEEEAGVFRRAKNMGHMQNVPKHATAGQYRLATGMEALFGYLYLCQSYARIGDLFVIGYPDMAGLDLYLFGIHCSNEEAVGNADV